MPRDNVTSNLPTLLFQGTTIRASQRPAGDSKRESACHQEGEGDSRRLGQSQKAREIETGQQHGHRYGDAISGQTTEAMKNGSATSSGKRPAQHVWSSFVFGFFVCLF